MKAKNRDKKAEARRGEYAREDLFKSEIGGFNRLFSKSNPFGKNIEGKKKFFW